ncbi:MAG: helix-turn-helix domain-containing protein [Magnetococcales bacterium]|nr:helix-turn-helix domain-containing protein [Magnetococcales bacterium]
MFHERLKLARKCKGLSLRDLATHINGAVSPQAIGKYERGEMMPSSTVCIALSKALGVSVSYLLSPSDIVLENVEFRKHVSTKARERALVEGAVLDHVDRYLQIEELLNFSSVPWDKPVEAPFMVKNFQDAEHAAEAVRVAWNLGGDPIPDMTELLEERGIKVLKLNFPSSVDGFTCKVRRPGTDGVPTVVCSINKSLERQRLTLAHELGHILLDVKNDCDEEKACQRFASAFLVPGEELFGGVGRRRNALGYEEIIEIKQMFGVSAAALVVRFRDLGIIKEATLKYIFSGMGRTWRKQEPNPLKRDESPRRFRRLCVRALAEKAISESKAAELLGLPVSKMERILSGPLE